MELEKIESYVRCLLESWAMYENGEEREVWQALHDLLMAVSRYELMSDADKELTTKLCKKLQYHFDTKFNLKERKRKTKKENFPPNPLLKEKIKKEKEQKTLSTVCDADSGFDEDLLRRLKAFEAKCEKYVGQYGRAMVDDFIRYWTLPNQTTGKMRFEEERYWRLSSKLKSWQSKSYTLDDAVAAMRLTNEQKKHQKDTDTASRQQQQAAKREDDNARLEQEIAERKRNAVSYEEYLRMKNGEGV